MASLRQQRLARGGAVEGRSIWIATRTPVYAGILYRLRGLALSAEAECDKLNRFSIRTSTRLIARELKSRGHAVTISTLAADRDRVMAEGLGFHPTRPNIDPNDKDELRRVMDKRNGPTYLLRDIVFRSLRESFVDCRAAASDSDLIVTHPVAYGMLLAARSSGRPWASVALSPVSLFSAFDASVPASVVEVRFPLRSSTLVAVLPLASVLVRTCRRALYPRGRGPKDRAATPT